MPTASDETADYILQAKTKAVVFTHISLKPEQIQQGGPDQYIAEYIPLFERYLKCRNVGLVYMYLSLGAEEIVRDIIARKKKKPLSISPRVMGAEGECLNVLQLAEGRAREKYPNKELRFIHVTTTQLALLFENLHEIDPKLLTFLCGRGVFSYDSPKFVEAVIRIARGQDPRSAYYPVVRFDEDVEICEESLDQLLTAYENFLSSNNNLFFFFSGCYGDPNDPDKLDPINDRAVRAHWFVDEHRQPQPDKIKLFWRDLGEIGASQLGVNDSPSLRGQNRIAERGFTANRTTPQVISGAGLIMSLRAIQDLPPFMNMGRPIVWIDDHLKRQLHERIGDIPSGELESVAKARFRQDRCHGGITQADIDWATSDSGYFVRLLAGCMMDALITQSVIVNNRIARQPTEFSQTIKNVMANPRTRVDYTALASKLRIYAERRYDRVLDFWQTPEFADTVMNGWAQDKAQNTEYKEKLVASIIENACAYLRLVQLWRESFAAAIGRLRPIGNLWLFERVH